MHTTWQTRPNPADEECFTNNGARSGRRQMHSIALLSTVMASFKEFNPLSASVSVQCQATLCAVKQKQ